MNETRPAAYDLMACLGEESRFRLVQALIGGARCVTDLAAAVGLSQSCTTRHLQVLERRRVVAAKRDGKRVLYRIREDDPGLLPLLGWALSEPGFRSRTRRRAATLARHRATSGSRAGRDRDADETPRTSEPRPDPQATTPEPVGRAPRPVGSDIEDYLL